LQERPVHNTGRFSLAGRVIRPAGRSRIGVSRLAAQIGPMLRPSPLVFVTLATALVLCWSSGFVGIRFATDSATVPQILFGRSIFSGLTLLPLALLRGPRITGRAIAEQGLYAFMGMFLYLGGFAVAIGRGVPTGLVALMADLVPLGIAVLSAPILGQALTRRQWLGTAIALAGVVLVSSDALALGKAPVLAYALPILGMLAFALSTVVQERRAAIPLFSCMAPAI
jgi:drug/metabolite transporter (DMT)-like permease